MLIGSSGVVSALNAAGMRPTGRAPETGGSSSQGGVRGGGGDDASGVNGNGGGSKPSNLLPPVPPLTLAGGEADEEKEEEEEVEVEEVMFDSICDVRIDDELIPDDVMVETNASVVDEEEVIDPSSVNVNAESESQIPAAPQPRTSLPPTAGTGLGQASVRSQKRYVDKYLARMVTDRKKAGLHTSAWSVL